MNPSVVVTALDPSTVADTEALRLHLDDDERARAARFAFPHLQRDFVAAHLLVRAALSDAVPEVPPHQWRFRAGAHGRPAVVEPAHSRPCFSLSHTDGLAVVAVSLDLNLGVDVERRVERANTLDIAPRYFAPAEVDGMQALPEPARPARFFDLWTLKESYIKATGTGLATPLDAFAFDAEPASPTIAFDPERLDDDPGRWTFVRFASELGVDDRFGAALALECGDAPEIRVRWWTARQLDAHLRGPHAGLPR